MLRSPRIRFFAAAPLSSTHADGGQQHGWLCLLDVRPRRLGAEQQECLSSLALACSRDLELQAALQHKEAAAQARLLAGLNCAAGGWWHEVACVRQTLCQPNLDLDNDQFPSSLPRHHCPAAEGIALLDLSTPGWRLLAANDAFRAAACLGQVTAGAEDGSADFWSVFEHVTDGNDSHKVGRVLASSLRASAHTSSQPHP